MRLGIMSNLGYNEPEEWAQKLRELGCGSVAFPVDHTEKEEIIQAYVKAAKKNDLLLAEVGAWCNPLSPNENERAKALEKCKGQLQLADKIGARCCVNVAGAIGEKWAGAYKENFSEETWDLTVRTIQEIIDAVQPENTYYAIEPMPYMYPMNPDQYLKLIECVNRDRFAVHMDVFNWMYTPEKYFMNEEFMEECFDKLGPFVKSCHLKDVLLLQELTCQLKEVPVGEGEINLEKYVLLAEKYDIEMPMILEHLKTSEAYLKSISYVKNRFEKTKITFF